MSRGRTELNHVLGFSRAGQTSSNRGRAKKIIRVDVSFHSTSASNRAMHWPTDTEPSRLAPPPASAARPPRASAVRRALRRYLERSFEMSKSKPARSVRRRSVRKARSNKAVAHQLQ